MNKISINDIQQQGIAVLSNALKFGPTKIVEPHSPVYVVLTEAEYFNLTKPSARQKNGCIRFVCPSRYSFTRRY